MAAMIVSDEFVHGIHAGILAPGRYLSSTTESLESQYVPAELGHLPPEVDKRDEGFIARREGGRRASRLFALPDL